jgi:MoxR-like ATPase
MHAPVEDLKDILKQARKEISWVIIGQNDVIDKALIAILTNNHVLIEGVPGVAKTLLVRTIARVLGCDFARIQFTPDLMPADITGTNIFNMQKSEFKLVRGPIFTDFLLADEINRAPAKTQSALLQAMQERTVTIDRQSYELSSNFTVFATQNPIEYEGTYPLPEAQKDRFMMKITMNTPERDEELILAQRTLGSDCPETVLAKGAIQPVISASVLEHFRTALQSIVIQDALITYCVDIVRASRTHQSILSGAGPRATQSLLLTSRAFAALEGRDFVIPEDIQFMAPDVLVHRIIVRPEFEIEGITPEEVVENILHNIAVPR